MAGEFCLSDNGQLVGFRIKRSVDDGRRLIDIEHSNHSRCECQSGREFTNGITEASVEDWKYESLEVQNIGQPFSCRSFSEGGPTVLPAEALAKAGQL
jgi:hypothetical protein